VILSKSNFGTITYIPSIPHLGSFYSPHNPFPKGTGIPMIRAKDIRSHYLIFGVNDISPWFILPIIIPLDPRGQQA
jgi:hypothetical protein